MHSSTVADLVIGVCRHCFGDVLRGGKCSTCGMLSLPSKQDFNRLIKETEDILEQLKREVDSNGRGSGWQKAFRK